MKVRIVGEQSFGFFAISDRLLLEEDEVVQEGGQVVIRTQDFDAMTLADLTVAAVYGEEPVGVTNRPYYYSKLFSRSKGYDPQTAIGIPLSGSNGEGLGYPTTMGCGVKLVTSSPHPFNKALRDLLEGMRYEGWVTLEMNQTKVQRIFLGCPCLMLYAIMECWPERLSTFYEAQIREDRRPFFERWTVAVSVACFPFPSLIETPEKVLVRGLDRPIRKHFWAFAPNGVMKESFKTNLTLLGVVTAWDHVLKNTCGRALTTCENIKIPMKIHRIDVYDTIARGYGEIKELLT